jgi:hypothetical protein
MIIWVPEPSTDAVLFGLTALGIAGQSAALLPTTARATSLAPLSSAQITSDGK